MPAPTGFALNGSTNAALKAMLTRGWGKIVVKGDSTSVGAGAAITADGTSSDVVSQLTGARPYRPSTVLASLMTGAGYPTVDNAFAGDASNGLFGVKLEQYDPRIDDGDWTPGGGATFAGGGYLYANAANLMKFTPTGNVGAFILDFYNTGGIFAYNIDGATTAIASTTVNGDPIVGTYAPIPNTGSGFTRIVVTLTSSTSPHEIQIAGDASLLRSVEGFTGATSAIRILNHASSGATSAVQAAGGSGWLNNDSLGYDAPDLTIIKLGLNDAAGAVGTSVYAANLQTIVTRAKLSGDVLVLWANAANPATFASQAAQQSYRDAAAAVAASSGVAFGDHLAAFGNWAAIGHRTADQTVHPNRGFYADIAAYDWQCLREMAGLNVATSYTLSAAAGTFTAAGHPARLLRSRRLAAQAGAFTLTGATASLKVARRLAASPGGFTLTGRPAALVKAGARVLAAAPGVFALSGAPASLRVSRRLAASTASYALTGAPATLRRSYVLRAATGAYALQGRAAGLTVSSIAPPAMMPPMSRTVTFGDIAPRSTVLY